MVFRKRAIPLNIASAVVALILFAMPAVALKSEPATKSMAPDSKQLKGWMLTQKSQSAGEYQVWLTPEAARLESSRSGYGLLIVGKETKVYEYNRRKKIYIRADIDGWKPMSAGDFFLRDGEFGFLRFERSNEEQGFGTTLRHQKLKTEEVFHGIPERKSEKLTVVKADYWVARSIPFPKSAAFIAQRLYVLPDCSGFPVKFEYVNRKAKHHVEMETITAQPATIGVDRMRMPADYKETHSRKQVFINPDGEETLKDMLLE
jgi:hypothetical protein